MSENQYSQEQIFCGIKHVWEDIGGNIPDSIDARIDENLKAAEIWDDVDLVDVFYRVAQEFGLKCEYIEWADFIGFHKITTRDEWENVVAPKFTFRRMCEFVAERISPVSLGPRIILGKNCQPGGAFLGIVETVDAMGIKVKKFGPSTRIRSRFRGKKLTNLYRRLRWMTCDEIPPLRTSLLTILKYVTGVSGALSCLVLYIAAFEINGLLGSIIPLVILGTILLCKLINYFDNRLPKGIETFRDLAEMVNEAQISNADKVKSSVA